jgi:hypothetical protein
LGTETKQLSGAVALQPDWILNPELAAGFSCGVDSPRFDRAGSRQRNAVRKGTEVRSGNRWYTAGSPFDHCVSKYQFDSEHLPGRKGGDVGGKFVGKTRARLEVDGALVGAFFAQPFDFNAGLGDSELSLDSAFDLRRIRGTNFFRGLPLIDLAEAMLHRAFGTNAVAVRVNGAGQGDYFQVHVDTELADPEEVKNFTRVAFYQRFSLTPENEFVEPHPGGGAVGVKLDRYDQLPAVIAELRQQLTGHRDQSDALNRKRLHQKKVKSGVTVAHD